MPYAPFDRLCPEIAQRETRSITVFPAAKLDLPPAAYEFVELYCDERGCDCRRVMFNVLSSATMQCAAVVAWGWESLDFYKNWLGMGDTLLVKDMQGPHSEPGQPARRPRRCHPAADGECPAHRPRLR